MDKKLFLPLIRVCFKSRFLFLITSILLLIVLSPLLQNFFRLKMIMNIFFTTIIISGIYAVSPKKQNSIIAALLALPMLVAMWSRYFVINPTFMIVGSFFGIFFIAFAIINILLFIFREAEISTEMIYAAIVVYLLLAVMWTFIYGVIELCHNGSFSIARQNEITDNRLYLLYYSFVTITTLGYGDITPLTDIARSFTLLEAVIGQIYLVVVVAWLVGMFVSQNPRKKSGKPSE